MAKKGYVDKCTTKSVRSGLLKCEINRVLPLGKTNCTFELETPCLNLLPVLHELAISERVHVWLLEDTFVVERPPCSKTAAADHFLPLIIEEEAHE